MPARRAPSSTRSRLLDVAHRARVSTMTVARVLREPHKVAPETRKRVAAALDATGYTPDLVARALVSRRSGVVGAIVPTLSNSLIADVIQGMSDALAREGRQLMVGASGFSAAREEELVRSFLSRRVDALYLTGTSHTHATVTLLRAAGIPVVQGGNIPAKPIDMAVGVSNVDAAAAVVAHLVARYGTRIAFAGAPPADNDRMRDRRAGYDRALRAAGGKPVAEWQIEVPMSMEGGRAAAQALLALPKRPRALFCANDVIAAGALLASVRAGVRVPDDFAIAGYDDLDVARELNPSLTSVRVPRYEIGRRAAELFHLVLSGDRPRRNVEQLDFELVVRESA
jgi:LacI family transcriptional regulator, gluconate utilization system Gnt-I transcriptional repressor